MPVPNAMPAKGKISALASKIKKIDVWIQEKCVPLFWVGAGLLITSTGLLLLWKWIQVISLAEQLAPVLTVLSIAITGMLGALRWFRKRHNKRLESAADDIRAMNRLALQPQQPTGMSVSEPNGRESVAGESFSG